MRKLKPLVFYKLHKKRHNAKKINLNDDIKFNRILICQKIKFSEKHE